MNRSGRAALGLSALLVMAGCGSPASSSLLNGDPSRYLITLDQLASPDFTVVEPGHSVGAVELGGTAQGATVLTANGFSAAATLHFFRSSATLSTANGPLDVVATVERFSSDSGAAAQLAADITGRERSGKQTAISTGLLGDEAHADVELAVAPDATQTQAIQITVEWRFVNLLNVVVVRGRYGGTRLDDALALAHRQATNELVGEAPTLTPLPSSPASSSSAKPGSTSPQPTSPTPSASPGGGG